MVAYTISRKLSPVQVKRRNNILSAMREIISTEGRTDFNMQDVAEKAGISRATLYRYYSDRNHLINDMALDWGLSLIERLQHTTPPGKTIGEKLTAIFASIFEEADQNPKLISITLSNIISPDYDMVASHTDIEQLLPSLLNMVISEKEVENSDFILGTLSRLTLANLLYLNSDRCDLKEATEYMSHVARLLYGEDIWNRTLS